ncbi:transcriptional regulator [Oceanihabitans sp. IOP_32]|uniref:transcriptional regulator n=1 Tax=Oceanihabitans sp. IOP_32 TaxID=2529032 RepID=UPI00129304EE|nr:transcriptional regulator [Oceanihabitans sp. IOP_32]QFZ53320.1 transcriptional regulator [Oceanihabitans sp. IOP_32]
MNYIKHLTGFFDKVINDNTLNPTHISLYIALFQFWNCNRFRNPISISRDEVMRISKISSKATYHKCLKNLHALGYIKYEPSYNPYKGSLVHLFNFSENLKPKPKNSKVIKQVTGKSYTGIDTSTEQAEVSYINSINNTNKLNNSNLNEQSLNSKNETLDLKKEVDNTKQKKLRQKNKSMVTPNEKDLINYFLEQNFPELEAKKFFNYFSSNGWLVGGKTPMANWKAAAQNWMINSSNFNAHHHNTDATPTIRPKNLNTATNKNYSEPL